MGFNVIFLQCSKKLKSEEKSPILIICRLIALSDFTTFLSDRSLIFNKFNPIPFA